MAILLRSSRSRLVDEGRTDDISSFNAGMPVRGEPCWKGQDLGRSQRESGL